MQTLWGGERFLSSVYGLDKAGAGVLLTIMGLGTAVGYALNGALGDRYGIARVAVFSLSGFLLCQLAFALQAPLVMMYPVYFLFGALGTNKASTYKEGGHPLMHRTETVDYALVLEGEIYIVLDREERLMKQGDFLVERGTNHAWANRSGRVCKMLFVLIDGKFDPEIGKHFA